MWGKGVSGVAVVAFFTVALMRAPIHEPESAALGALFSPLWATAEGGSGFVAQSKQETESHGRVWGPLALPTVFRKAEYEARMLTTLSLWTAVEAVYAYTYNGLHRTTFANRAEWFAPTIYPNYVAWWVADDHTPTWMEACERYDWFQQHGPGPTAFDFRHVYDVNGEPMTLQHELIEAHALSYRPPSA